jgi:predicted Zn-dependent peptidase
MKRFVFGYLIVLFPFLAFAQKSNVTQYQLDNGLTVILNEDHSQPTVFGSVVVRAGSKDDPDDATGLAHYMEHVMFKGTDEMGTSDWEAEKPHYENIINLYEELRSTEDEEKKKEINKKINEESLLAGKYAIPNEFSNLIQAMGGTGLNAGTSYDLTFYHNSFPPFQISKWLHLYAHRFVNPVYRGFQSELETVYEEKNMYSDNPFRSVQNDFLLKAFGEENPYGRPIIGLTEHLRNPSIKRIVEFYNAFYVPSNMALVLSGDINPDEIKPIIEETFGKWEKREATGKHKKPSNIQYTEAVKYKEKLTPYPMVFLGFPAVPVNDADEKAYELCIRLLSNSNRTGLLDKLVLEGDLLTAQAAYIQHKYSGLALIQAIPTFDVNQMKYVSLSTVEKMINKEVENLQKGAFEDWLVEAIKNELAREFDESSESPVNMGMTLMQNFVYETSFEDFSNYKNEIQEITKEDIVRVANKYFTKNRITYLSDIGSPKKDNLKKPSYDPIDPTPGTKSTFAAYLEEIPFSEVKSDFVNMDQDIKRGQLADKVKLFYTENPKNNIFYLTLKFGVGTGKIPGLALATQLMNSAGVMAQYQPQELKNEYSKLGCSVNFSVSESYLYIYLKGDEKNLGEACKLLSKTFLLPQLDEKQMNNAIGSVFGSRRVEKKEKDIQAAALFDYMVYGSNSPELTRMSNAEIQALSISDLTGAFISATQYEASVHFVGKLPFEKATEVLKANLFLPSNLKPSESPFIRPVASSNTETIYFLNNPEARQSQVYLFIDGTNYSTENQPMINAFNEYFSGGFNGIVLQELREKRSFAYSAGAVYQTPPIPNKKTFFYGLIGTQSDKTADAVAEFVKLIKEMPEKPERIDNIRQYLVLSSQASRPNFKNLSQIIESWELKGYTDDPNKLFIDNYKNLSFEDIVAFYEKEIAGRPISIAIVGNKKEIDMDKLESVAKVTTINTSKIFKN